jgi:hypothetical protein
MATDLVMKEFEHERPDWIIVTIILVIGFLCVIAAGQLALRFAPFWQLPASMDSRIDPDSGSPLGQPDGSIPPVGAGILTRPAWMDVYLTPGATFVTGTPIPPATSTRVSSPTSTRMSTATDTARPTQSPTNTFIYIPPSRTPTALPTDVPPTLIVLTDTPEPSLTPTETAISFFTATGTLTPTSPATETATATATITPTGTATSTATPTPTFTPGPIPTDTTPGEIGTTPDGVVYMLRSGGSLTLGINLTANGDSSYDLAYYERPAPTGNGIFLDWVIVQISDGYTWYTVFNWGNDIADTNSNMNFNILPNPQVPPEGDQRDIPTTSLYNGTGIAIDVDAIVPPGTYSYLRFIAPTGDADGQMEIDAVEVLP